MGGVARLQATDNFHQRHQRHRVEEVHANKAVGAPGDGGQLGDGNGRGVGGNDHIRANHGFDLLDDLDLEIVVFGGRLDHQLRRLEVCVAGAAVDQCHGRVALGCSQLVLLHQTLQARDDGGQALVDGLLGDIHHHHLDARNRASLRNAVAHGARANNANRINMHIQTPLKTVCRARV